ncbi:hypothetical protein [Gorillibacterium sp. CAU 1737]|uniref:hypothetical protein n=1 Tax=Gorillibacterium sp. CAU 1737 TaxID=3140362 RepID=UPI00326036EF
MNGLTRYALAAVMSMGIAVGLSQLSKSEFRPESVAVSGKEDDSRLLTASTLVDRMAELPFYLPLRHVAWENGMLSVDFKAPAAVDVAAVYSDVYRSIRFGLAKTANVEEVRVRVYGKAAGSSEALPLLMSADARREDGIRFGREELPEADQVKRFLETRCRLTETERWRGMLGH